jgi:hypothetical protein
MRVITNIAEIVMGVRIFLLLIVKGHSELIHEGSVSIEFIKILI